jgi:xanthosine utilization system XapX-like protein
MFLLLLFITSLSAGLVFGVLAAVVSVVSMAQASLAFVVVILVLFSGFTVQPDVIPV